MAKRLGVSVKAVSKVLGMMSVHDPSAQGYTALLSGEFLDIVRSRMKEKDLRQEQVAEMLGMLQSNFSRKLSGQVSFAYEELRMLCDICGVRMPMLERGMDTERNRAKTEA